MAKPGENSSTKFWAKFLFDVPSQGTYLGVLETIESLALGSKPGPQEDNLTFRLKIRHFDHVYKMSSGSIGLTDGNSTQCGLTYYIPRAFHKKRSFGI